jgi:hypothetical protein
MAIRPIRTNNPGDLRAPDEATARKWWGKHGFVGLDDQNQAIFETAAGGRAALEQQIRIDQGREQTQEEFINKYVGATADPQGTANAQINIPRITGASPGTPLSEIDKDKLFEAITVSEGGQDSLDYFRKSDFDALDRAHGRVVAEPGISLPTAPEPTIESETVKPTATGLTGDQLTQRILDQEARLAEEEASGPPLPTAAAPTVESKPVAQAREFPTSITVSNRGGQVTSKPQGTPEASKGNLLQKLGGFDSGIEAVEPGAEDWGTQFGEGATPGELDNVRRQVLAQDVENVRDGGTPRITLQTKPWSSEGHTRVADIKGELTGAAKEQALLKSGGSEEEITKAIEEGVLPSGEQRVQREVAVQRTAPRENEMISRYENAAGSANNPYSLEPAPETATPEPETATPEPSFLSRLGSPELLAQIAQAGGGFMQDIAQGRAQKKADARTRGAMAQSNLIGALTGGKSRPAVMREEAEQGGLLARLGQAVEIGGSVAGGEMKRRTALSQRDEEMGLERDKVENAAKRLQVDLSQADAQKAYQGRMLELQKLGISNDLLIAQAKAGKKDEPPQKVYDAYLAAQNVMDTVGTVEELMRDAGVMQAGPGLMALRAAGLEQGLPQFLGGAKTREITASVNKMVQTLGEDMTGILSNQDILFLKAQAPSDEDSLETVIKKADLIRNRVAGSIANRAGIDADYFDMTPFGSLIDSVTAQGEQAPGDLAEKLGQTEIKLP